MTEENMVAIRRFREDDAFELRQLFYNTVRLITIRDYSLEQVEAWAPDEYNKAAWAKLIENINPFIATLHNEITGYADVQDDGFINHFFCHSQHQRKGIGKKLMKTILAAGKEKSVPGFRSHVNITARPFFESFGFQVVKRQEVKISGQILHNFVMEKHCQ